MRYAKLGARQWLYLGIVRVKCSYALNPLRYTCQMFPTCISMDPVYRNTEPNLALFGSKLCQHCIFKLMGHCGCRSSMLRFLIMGPQRLLLHVNMLLQVCKISILSTIGTIKKMIIGFYIYIYIYIVLREN